MDMPGNATSLPYQLLWGCFPPHPPMHGHTPVCKHALVKVPESLGWGQFFLALIVVVEDITASDCRSFLFPCTYWWVCPFGCCLIHFS